MKFELQDDPKRPPTSKESDEALILQLLPGLGGKTQEPSKNPPAETKGQSGKPEHPEDPPVGDKAKLGANGKPEQSGDPPVGDKAKLGGKGLEKATLPGNGPKTTPLEEKVEDYEADSLRKIMPPLSDTLAQDIDRVRANIFAYQVRKGTELIEFVNTHAKEPVPVLRAALKDNNALVFVGDQHTYSYEAPKLNPMRDFNLECIDDMEAGSVKAIEVPTILKPVFEKFNQSKPGTEMEIPEHLEGPNGDKALKYLRNIIKLMPDEYRNMKNCRDHGVVLVPIDNERVLLTENSPEWKKAMQECDGYMAEEMLELIKKYPGKNISVDIGTAHGSKRGETDEFGSRPLAFLLEQDPRFQISGRHIVSFGSIVGNADTPPESHGLASMALLASRSFIVPTHEGRQPNIVGQLPYYPNKPELGNLDGHDYMVVSKGEQGMAGDKKRPIIDLAKDTDEDKAYWGRHIPVPESMTKSLEELVAQDKPLNEKVLALKHLINTQVTDPVKEVAKDLTGGNIVLMSLPEQPNGNAFNFDYFPKYFENLCKEMPKGTRIGIKYPSALQPLFDEFNSSPPGTKFIIPKSLPDEEGTKALASLERIDPTRLKIWQTAHDNGMSIVPLANMAHFVPDEAEAKALRQRESADIKNKIVILSAKDRNHPILALLESEDCMDTAGKASKPSVFDLLKPYANIKDRGISLTNVLCHDQSSLNLSLSTFTWGIREPVSAKTHTDGKPNLLGRLPVLQNPETSNDKLNLSSVRQVIIFPAEIK